MTRRKGASPPQGGHQGKPARARHPRPQFPTCRPGLRRPPAPQTRLPAPGGEFPQPRPPGLGPFKSTGKSGCTSGRGGCGPRAGRPDPDPPSRLCGPGTSARSPRAVEGRAAAPRRCEDSPKSSNAAFPSALQLQKKEKKNYPGGFWCFLLRKSKNKTA